MVQIFKITIYIFITLIFISCNSKKEEKIINVFEKNIHENKILSYNFPDTVRQNTVINGRLRYNINNINFDPELINNRYLHMILTTNKYKELLSFDEIEEDYLLGYVDSLNTGKFNFKAVFKDGGNQVLNIAIRDYMYLKPNENTPPDKMTLRTSDCLFSKKVYVIE